MMFIVFLFLHFCIAQLDKYNTLFEFFRTNTEQVVLHKEDNHIYRKRALQSKLDLTKFNEIIGINIEHNYIHVEGLVRFDDLFDYTQIYGYMPQVVPELRSITVGGAISGVGLESSSFKYGLFHDTVFEYEVITGNGEIVICNNETNSDLYFGMPNSYGTFGYILSAKLKIVKTKPYVKITNTHFTNPELFISEIEKYDSTFDFIDATILNKTNMYISHAIMVDNIYTNTLSKYGIDIYYKSISNKQTDYMTIKEYIWRYDSNYFYLGGNGEYIYENWLFRTVVYPILRSDYLRKLGQNPILNRIMSYITSRHSESIVNDLSVDTKAFVEFLEWFDSNINVYPVWVCPYITLRDTFFLEKEHFGIDFGIGFGVSKYTSVDDEPNKYRKMIDQKMFSMKRKKGLYPATFLEYEQFTLLYDDTNVYDTLKSKYDTNRIFPSLYDKVCKNV